MSNTNNTSQQALVYAGLSRCSFHFLPCNPKLAVTLDIVGACSVTSLQGRSPGLFPRSGVWAFVCQELLCATQAGTHGFFSLHADPWSGRSVSNSSDKLIRVIQSKINLLKKHFSFPASLFKCWPEMETDIMSQEILYWTWLDRLFSAMKQLPVEFKWTPTLFLSRGAFQLEDFRHVLLSFTLTASEHHDLMSEWAPLSL